MNTKDFTMVQDGVSYESYAPQNAFGWMVEGVDEIANPAQYVREYAKSLIANWRDANNVKASEATIYKVWRSGYEFDRIVRYLESHED